MTLCIWDAGGTRPKNEMRKAGFLMITRDRMLALLFRFWLLSGGYLPMQPDTLSEQGYKSDWWSVSRKLSGPEINTKDGSQAGNFQIMGVVRRFSTQSEIEAKLGTARIVQRFGDASSAPGINSVMYLQTSQRKVYVIFGSWRSRIQCLSVADGPAWKAQLISAWGRS